MNQAKALYSGNLLKDDKIQKVAKAVFSHYRHNKDYMCEYKVILPDSTLILNVYLSSITIIKGQAVFAVITRDGLKFEKFVKHHEFLFIAELYNLYIKRMANVW